MSIIVQKYGGSSVSDVARIKKVADRVAAAKAAGKDVVVVVSAMGDTTDDLLKLAAQVTDSPARRELDMLLTAGERISMALLSLALNARNVPAVSFTGSQSGIITNDSHANARIVEVRPFRVQDELERGKVVIVAGYQGVSYKREVTTLGRGGSDTTAVALAAALDAEACEIYSDVEGVYSADPRVVKDASRLAELSYEEMQELAEAGAKVLNAQAVEFAKEKGIVIYARSTHGGAGETVVRKSPPRAPGRVVGIASESGLVVLTTRAGRPDGLTGLVEILDKRQVGGKQLHFEGMPGLGGSATIVLSLENIHTFVELRQELSETFGKELTLREGVGAVSAVGAGINATFANLRRFLAVLAGMDAPLIGLSTSSFRISALVDERHVEEAVRRLHAELVARAEPTAPGV
jgi:aspartate kinase